MNSIKFPWIHHKRIFALLIHSMEDTNLENYHLNCIFGLDDQILSRIMKKATEPQNKKSFSEFLRKVAYLHKFIPHMSSIAVDKIRLD